MSVQDLDHQLGEKILNAPSNMGDFVTEIDKVSNVLPQRINTDPECVDHGLAKLVLTIIELLRQLMERQALRRIENGSLSDEEIERLGQTFIKLEDRMGELLQIFDLEDEDLNINLGPLGDLM